MLGSTIRNIGPSATKNFLNMRFALEIRTDFLNPFRMNWRGKASTIVPYPIKNGVALRPPYRLKITGKEL